MNSRERLLKTLKHEEPDKIPVDIGQGSFTGIHIKAYKNLLDYLGKGNLDIKIHDYKQQLAKVDEEILKILNVDVRGVYFNLPESWTMNINEASGYFSYKDHWGIKWRMPKNNGLYYDLWEPPLEGKNLSKAIDYLSLPDAKDSKRVANALTKAKQLKKDNKYFVTLGGSAMTVGYFQEFQWLQGITESYINLSADPKGSEKLLDRLEELELEFWDWFLPQNGKYIDMMMIPDDFSGQNGLLISKEMFQKFFKPRYSRLFGRIKELSPNTKIFFHSCGAIMDLIEDFIEMGIDILNPLQYSASNMDLSIIKKKYGKELCFWGGGIDTQKILPNSSEKEVKEEVKKNIEILGPGGGFIFSTIHNIQSDVPPQNIIAMCEALEEYGKY